VCEILNVKPQAVVHIGDHWVFDFINPRKIGITAYYLDRAQETGKERTTAELKEDDAFIISDLNELIDDPVG
jgi:FMN phosphatase YigB (HAD superfamily)